jgi:hypothetical protein
MGFFKINQKHFIYITQSVHMKCIPFYCNIAHEPKGRGMKTTGLQMSMKIIWSINQYWSPK